MRRLPLALLMLVVALALAAPRAGAAEGDRTLGVQGLGQVELTPDVGSFDAQVDRTAPSSAAARAQTNARLRAIVDALTALEVPRTDITTTAVQLTRERYRRPHAKRVRVRYRAAGAFAVRVEGTEKLGRVLEAVAAAGATGIDGPEFSFSTALQTMGRQQAEQASLADARTRADAAAASQGMRISGVRSIELDPGTESATESDASESAASAPASATTSGKAAVPAPVLPGRQTFSSTVRVLYLMEPVS